VSGDDRFEDLGGGNGRTPGERLAERDITHPEPVKGPPEVPRAGRNKYAWAVGIVALMGLSVLLFANTLPNSGKGIEGPTVGKRLPAFAAPLATGNLDGDANVCQRRPCNKNAGKQPACEVRDPDAANSCQLSRGNLVLTFMVTRGADCEPQVDRVERVKGDYGNVTFAVVMSGNSRDDAASIAKDRGWSQPVLVDRDGQVVNLYGIGICPVTVFAKKGRVVATELGNLTEAQLRSHIRKLFG
jgi:hypothetical protein